MPLAAGTKLGPYEILSPLGAGGMGEVYRARDTKLDREIAIKALPEKLSEDNAPPARFQGRRGRDGRGLSSSRHQARPRSRDQSPSREACRRQRRARAVRAGGQGGRGPL